MKILITGGGGFQGSHLAESLTAKGHQVTIVTTYNRESEANTKDFAKRGITVVFGSITDRIVVNKTVPGHDVIFHLAANVNVDESREDPLSFVQVNIIQGTFNILEAARKHNVRLIYASTCEVYGDGHDLAEGELLKETAELKPNSPYAASKASADRLCYSYYKTYGMDITIVRPFNIYGERQKNGTFGALIPIMVRRALKGVKLTVFGDGSATRDYLYISDLIDAYHIVLKNDEKLAGKVINFASGVDTSVKDIAEYIAKKLDGEIEYGPARPGEVSRFPADISFATSLGFSPKVDIWEGIDRYIDWAKKHPERL